MNNIDTTALFKLGYGLYVVTSNDGEKDNGLIVNTVMQVAVSPDRLAVAINKANYSHDVIKKTGIMNVNCLTEGAPFSLFKSLGFRSGRDCSKLSCYMASKSENGLAVLPDYVNAFISLKVEQYIDLGSHGMFICAITESKRFSDAPSMTYDFYHKHVKPAPPKKKGYVCKICGYVYEGEPLPDDFICPLCKHGVSDFEKLQ